MAHEHSADLATLLDCPELEAAVVRFVTELTYDDLDEPALAGLNRLLRDQIALEIGTSRMPWSRQVLDYTLAVARPGRSRIAAHDGTVSAADAAFVNGTYGHGFEYDDAHGPSAAHPGSCVIPAAFAIGEELGSTLRDVLTALVAGYEVYTRIGVLAAPDLLARGFHPHAVLSTFGAAAVAAKLRGFDARTTLDALAIALSRASGTTEYSSTGGSIKRVHAGIGTQGGMVAADLAAAGLTGPHGFLSGSKGFFRTFLQRGPGEDAAAAFDAGKPMEIATVWLKAYCACYCTHAYIDALRPFADRVEDIAHVRLHLHPAFDVIVGNANANAFAPRNIEHVQFSLPAQASFTLLGLGNGYRVHRDYLAGEVDLDPVRAFTEKITIIPEQSLADRYPGKFVADVEVEFGDGTVERVFVEDPIGTDLNPMSEAEQDAKFAELTVDVIGERQSAALLAALRDPALDAPVTDLTALYVPPRG
ncbi:MAG: MmgE/PrpD family protein [Gordonia sp. (in: high G+C Gram-positive bacteria)]|uniref:MmgE/PrpD family protein n=1 Tax=Gordonia sp. (in: high G+C Gram-positive bacteria) TaxID=84139 RepID=UPI0039E58381